MPGAGRRAVPPLALICARLLLAPARPIPVAVARVLQRQLPRRARYGQALTRDCVPACGLTARWRRLDLRCKTFQIRGQPMRKSGTSRYQRTALLHGALNLIDI